MVEPAIPIQDLHHSIINPVLEAQKEIKVAEAHVGVDGHDGEAEAGEGEADVGGGGGLADAALAGGDDDDARGLAG